MVSQSCLLTMTLVVMASEQAETASQAPAPAVTFKLLRLRDELDCGTGQRLPEGVRKIIDVTVTPLYSEDVLRARWLQFKRLAVGDQIDARDSENRWCAATIVDKNESEGKILVHFEGWSDKWNEWLQIGEGKIAMRETKWTTDIAGVSVSSRDGSAAVHVPFGLITRERSKATLRMGEWQIMTLYSQKVCVFYVELAPSEMETNRNKRATVAKACETASSYIATYTRTHPYVETPAEAEAIADIEVSRMFTAQLVVCKYDLGAWLRPYVFNNDCVVLANPKTPDISGAPNAPLSADADALCALSIYG